MWRNQLVVDALYVHWEGGRRGAKGRVGKEVGEDLGEKVYALVGVTSTQEAVVFEKEAQETIGGVAANTVGMGTEAQTVEGEETETTVSRMYGSLQSASHKGDEKGNSKNGKNSAAKGSSQNNNNRKEADDPMEAVSAKSEDARSLLEGPSHMIPHMEDICLQYMEGLLSHLTLPATEDGLTDL
tara:strand:- start:295 stop:846 length:552 start_codon:yes stop_codon:yes gene_type:complete